jgi:hypothetical protein
MRIDTINRVKKVYFLTQGNITFKEATKIFLVFKIFRKQSLLSNSDPPPPAD